MGQGIKIFAGSNESIDRGRTSKRHQLKFVIANESKVDENGGALQ